MDRKYLVGVLSGALVLPMAVQAVDFSVSGHIGRAIVIEDGQPGTPDTDVSHTDTGASPSRFRMVGSSELDAGVTGGVVLEYGTGNDPKDSPSLRHANVYLSGGFGKLALGQQSRATDGVPYSSFDGGAWLGGVEIGCDYCTADFMTTYSGGRGEVIRYDTPALGPASVTISSDANDRWDASVKIAGSSDAGSYELKGGVTDDNGKQNRMVAGAVGLAGGAHANMAWGESDDSDSGYWHIGVGYNVSDTSVAAVYTTSDIDGGGSSWAVGVGHSMGEGVQIFASYRAVEFDDGMHEADMADDYGMFVIGSRVSFN